MSELPSFGKMFGSKIRSKSREESHLNVMPALLRPAVSHPREEKRCLNLPFIPLLLSYAGFLLLTTPTWRLKCDEADADADGIGSGRPGSRACQTAEEWVTKDDVLVGVPAFACSQKEYMYKPQLTPTSHHFLLDFCRIFQDILVSCEHPANSPP